MRMQVKISDELMEHLEAMAWREKRLVRHQAELLLEQAIQRAMSEALAELPPKERPCVPEVSR
jgi:hypothetical protein